MKIFAAALVIVVFGGAVFWSFISNTERSVELVETETQTDSGMAESEPEAAATTDQMKSSSSDTILQFEADTFISRLPNGEIGREYEVSIPYLTIDNQRVYPFGEQKNIWIRGASVSPSENFVYLGKGAGPGDAGVQAYVYDVRNRSLEAVVREDGLGIGFASEEQAVVTWKGDILHIEYDNTGLAPGASESGPVIGLRIYESVSSEHPWITEQIN